MDNQTPRSSRTDSAYRQDAPALREVYRSSHHPLPAPLSGLIQAGHLEEAEEMIAALQKQALPCTLRCRLLLAAHRLRRLSRCYPHTRADILRQLQGLSPDIQAHHLQQWESAGRVDFRFIQGEKRYFEDLVPSLKKNGTLRPFGVMPAVSDDGPSNAMMAEIQQRGHASRRLTIRHTIAPAAATDKPVIIHLPFPLIRDQQQNVVLLAGTPDQVAGVGALQRTASWQGVLDPGKSFAITYQYEATIRHAQPLTCPPPDHPLYPDAPPPTPDDLDCPFPAIHQLAKDLSQGCTTPAAQAWAFYRYITEQCTYSYVPDYILLDHLETYVLLHRQGDCGLQALLFLHLCRSVGIPARWQSGLVINQDGSLGSHDWAQFYLAGWGWLFCDPSHGGAAFRRGNGALHAFYFGHISPMRMAANANYLAPFTPDFPAFRHDPTDNQTGEIALVGADSALLPPHRVVTRQLVAMETL